tara:strand:+ start:51 stop:758 length:708 start_codon:yes stop_codon:yes gene_type:complete
MYWSRKFKLSDCRECNYIGIRRNDKRHAELYVCDKNNKLRKRGSRVLTRKEDVLANKLLNLQNEVNCDTNCIKPSRSLQHLYRSNAQPNKNERKYSYSYNDFLRVKRYSKNLPTSSKWKANEGSSTSTGFGGNCNKDSCKIPTVIWKPNNKQFSVQGAVPSSSRLDKLKLDTIRAEKSSKTCGSGNEFKCFGLYYAGKPRNEGFIFNKNHKEINCPQTNAVGRVRGNTSQKTINC